MTAVLLACTAQVVYIVAFILFKTATGAMEPLTGRRPLRAAGKALSSGRWLLGLVLLIAGFALGDSTLVTLPIAAALPAYGIALALVLLAGRRWFGERFATREWFGVSLTAMAMVVAVFSLGLPPFPGSANDQGVVPERAGPLSVPDFPSPWALALVGVPSLLIPLWMFTVRDRAIAGRHARRLTGIAYGMGAGVLLGTAEVFGLGVALLLADGRRDVLGTPYPYLFLLAGVLGIGLLSIGLQRCRLSLFVTVLTVTAKLHLLLSATLLYGEPWPSDPFLFQLRVGAVLLAAIAVLTFPRHERRTAPARTMVPQEETTVAEPASARPVRG